MIWTPSFFKCNINMRMDELQKLWKLYNQREFKKLIKKGKAVSAHKKGQDIELFRILGTAHDQQALLEKDKTKKLKLQKKAIYYFKQILRSDLYRASAYRGLGLVALHQNRLKNSLDFYKKAYSLDKRDISNFISLGNVYRAIGQYSRAFEWYKKCLVSKEENIKLIALVNIAVMLGFQKKTLLAKKYALKALKITHKHPQDKWMENFKEKLESITLKRDGNGKF